MSNERNLSPWWFKLTASKSFIGFADHEQQALEQPSTSTCTSPPHTTAAI
jgi:hypothetical protein